MSNLDRLQFGGYFPPFPLKAGRSALEDAEAVLHRRIAIVMWYQWWGTNWVLGRAARDVQPRWLAQAGDRDVLIKWEPWTPGRRIVQPEFAVEAIARGAHDAYLRRWARRIRDCARRVFLCPLPEPNGFWFHWSAVVGKHRPEDYVAAWRHIHAVFQDEGAANVRWVWSPNAGDVPPENLMERYYPGADTVDVLGLSVYNWGVCRSWSQWLSFGDIVQPPHDRIAGLGLQPVWITEMACAPEGGDRLAWIRAMLAFLPELPRLEALLWFNTKKETDWRITTRPEIAREFSSATD